MKKELYFYLKQNYNFKMTYLETLKVQMKTSKSIVSDIVYEVISWQDEKTWMKQYDKFLKRFMDRLFEEIEDVTNKLLIKHYLMDEKRARTIVGVNWVKLEASYINLDDLLEDF
jgi:enoyl reductase-like protein